MLSASSPRRLLRHLYFQLKHPAVPWILLALLLLEWSGEKLDAKRYAPRPAMSTAGSLVPAFDSGALADSYEELKQRAVSHLPALPAISPRYAAQQAGSLWEEVKGQAWDVIPELPAAVGRLPIGMPDYSLNPQGWGRGGPTLPDTAYFPPQAKPSWGPTRGRKSREGFGQQAFVTLLRAF